MNVKFDKGKIVFEGEELTTFHKEVITTPLEKVQGVLKCSACGGSPEMKDVNLSDGTFTCPFCRTVNTLPNFGRTPEGPKVTNITNTYYVNCNGPEEPSVDEDGVRIPTTEELLPHNILKTHLNDIFETLGFKKRL